MAKDKDKKEQHDIKPVANRNQSIQPVTNFDKLEQNNNIIGQSDIEGLILTYRGIRY